MINRRTFIQKSMLATAGIRLAPSYAPFSLEAKPGSESEKMNGIRMGGYSFYDEGMEYVLDFLQKEAKINTLMIYSHTPIIVLTIDLPMF